MRKITSSVVLSRCGDPSRAEAELWKQAEEKEKENQMHKQVTGDVISSEFKPTITRVVRSSSSESPPLSTEAVATPVPVKAAKAPTTNTAAAAACGTGPSGSGTEEDEEEDLEQMFVMGPAGMEWGGPTRGGKRPEPTRFGDWERKGRASDF